MLIQPGHCTKTKTGSSMRKSVRWNDVHSERNSSALGERQVLIYPHRDLLGRIVMSYLGIARERSRRASYGFISFFVRRIPSGYSPWSRFTVGCWPHHVIRRASCKITFRQFNKDPPHLCSKIDQQRSIGLNLL